MSRHSRYSRARSYFKRKEERLRFSGLTVFSLMAGALCYMAAEWYFSLPIVHRSAETGQIVAIEDGKTGREIPGARWSNALAGPYNVVHVP
jgi:hypothetical protein